MSTGATLLVVACWVLAIGVPVTVALMLRRQRRRLDAVNAEMQALQRQVADLGEALRRAEAATREQSAREQAAREQAAREQAAREEEAATLQDAVEGEGVQVITRLPEPDELDLTASRVASVTLAAPLIKVAALSHGVRQALHEDHRMRIQIAIRKELRRQRKLRRRRRALRGPSEGWLR